MLTLADFSCCHWGGESATLANLQLLYIQSFLKSLGENLSSVLYCGIYVTCREKTFWFTPAECAGLKLTMELGDRVRGEGDGRFGSISIFPLESEESCTSRTPIAPRTFLTTTANWTEQQIQDSGWLRVKNTESHWSENEEYKLDIGLRQLDRS